MIVVSDTSAITAQIQIGRTELLLRLFDKLEQKVGFRIGKELRERLLREDNMEQ